MRRVVAAVAAAVAGVAAARKLLPPAASPVVSCPVCGTGGSPYYPHPYKTWANAGRDDDGTYLRRCRHAIAKLRRPDS